MNEAVNPARCPLCGHSNHCQLCTLTAWKGPCWCAQVSIPEALRARISAESRDQGCICPSCVMSFHREQAERQPPPPPRAGDFYFENGLVVFTAAYHLRRGYCCGSRCRHCPYREHPWAGGPG
jgi:hypothetical protein